MYIKPLQSLLWLKGYSRMELQFFCKLVNVNIDAHNDDCKTNWLEHWSKPENLKIIFLL